MGCLRKSPKRKRQRFHSRSQVRAARRMNERHGLIDQIFCAKLAKYTLCHQENFSFFSSKLISFIYFHLQERVFMQHVVYIETECRTAWLIIFPWPYILPSYYLPIYFLATYGSIIIAAPTEYKPNDDCSRTH